ncbi:FBXO43 family protein [Megaselia abdita]
MDAKIPETPGVLDPHHKFDSFYNDMDSGYQSFDVKNSSISLAATHSTPVKRGILPDISVGFTISRGSLLQETIEEVPSTDTPKKRKCCVSNSNSLPKKLKIHSGNRIKIASSSKRKLIPDDGKPASIPTNEGRAYMDFLTELNQGYSKVLREIFRLLSAEDLHNMTLVSHKWSAIINENTQSDLKINLKNFRHKLSDSKENLDIIKKEKYFKENDSNFKTKKPFSLYNKKKEMKRANTLAGGEFFSSPSKKTAIKNDWGFHFSSIFPKTPSISSKTQAFDLKKKLHHLQHIIENKI